METILYVIIMTCIVAGIAINLVLPCAYSCRSHRLAESRRLSAIKSLYGHHYQRQAFLMCDKR